jgi:pimeloyl-ACP methyl ester carboxylesterase
MRLRLHHHADGARVAYRETGSGPPLVLLHAGGLSHREWEPVVEPLAARFRLVLPDLPLHGDSEDRPRHPYSPDWLADVLASFCAETAGPRPRVVGHGAGAEILLRAVITGRLTPARMVLMPNRLHRPSAQPGRMALWRAATRASALPGLDRLGAHAAALTFNPAWGDRLTATHAPGTHDLMRHAFQGVPGNATRARAWARAARRWPREAQSGLLDAYPQVPCPVLLLWADRDLLHPLEGAQEALDLLPDGQLRVLSDCGHLMTYDDPVGVARELIAFCG